MSPFFNGKHGVPWNACAKFFMFAQLPRVFVLYVHMFSLGDPFRVVFYIVGVSGLC